MCVLSSLSNLESPFTAVLSTVSYNILVWKTRLVKFRSGRASDQMKDEGLAGLEAELGPGFAHYTVQCLSARSCSETNMLVNLWCELAYSLGLF